MNDCWYYAGYLNIHGYANLRLGKTNYSIHRVMYEQEVGKIPQGLQVDHLCRVRHCINPAHMELVTSRENTLRGNGPTAKNARKTHCPKGHKYDGVQRYKQYIFRKCLTCSRESALRAYYEQKSLKD